MIKERRESGEGGDRCLPSMMPNKKEEGM